ncbi:MAG: NAD-dependent epimerase/dehydratase family protein [Bacteroidales bacterium]|nr:NAD-dependent epimerase/dehydratase family protein [Bacteroidales bacterium]MCF8328326.1 NAD-dependent epimerase/dehydratase family protein [Bacteroidales bacterium]
MKVLVTGANGLLGTHITLELLTRGYEVNAIVRHKEKMKISPRKGLTLFEGKFTNAYDISEAIKSCDYVIHAAALTSQDIRDFKKYRKINIEGTKTILEAAKKNEIKKFVYVSTANAFGYGTITNPGSEKAPSLFPFTKSFYAQSKTSAQKIILNASEEIPVNIVNPTFMLGAYGTGNGSDKIVLWGLNKRFLFYPPGGKNFIHVSDAAKATVNITEKAASGEAYLLCNENLSYRDFFQKIIHYNQQETKLIKVPGAMLLLAGFAGSLLRTFGIKTEFSLTNMRILCVQNYYTNAKAKPYLPDKLKSTDQAIQDTIHWLKKQSIIDG